MYLLKDKHPAYWMYTENRATSTLHSNLQKAFTELTLNDHIWDPSAEDCNVNYQAEGNYFVGYDAETNKKLERNQYIIAAKLPDNCTYEQFITQYPEFLI